MARTSITTLYTGFLFVLVVIFVTEMAFGRPLERELLPTGITGSAITPVEDRKGNLDANPENVGLKGKTTGSSDIQGVAQQKNKVRGKGNAEDLKGKLKATGSGNVANVATGEGTLKPKGDLKKGELEVTGTGSAVVAGVPLNGNVGVKQGSNSQNEKKQTYGSHSNGMGEPTAEEPPKNYVH
ncbi:hypothetical protein MKW98_019043 [Papaver atlanticum]|uniref:Uncharacterized protein n=1 Tax=Papaver atlanticum TaxID=357466 RepID=A0AAD4XTM7_9MAGN|nr:hypothetical protein MKW98_016403 [Papaver atlanticum]KAI3959453.1 hypothetical protein MKW98_019043 [Papaver atlanticum]